ncbi:GNAT family N-acetyltransferase [Crenalkalicoccus roseus]|uniref:GNAT family N-acetyltransferase n=1 Tax=Crenalkalicoccus roseus TaxID=1485588 RepID=UPI0010817656|nr:GNAT family N-acetyltransferase [Crenalkalicoccus roseus]
MEARSVLTARLRLRPFRPEDAPAYAAIRARPEVVRFLPGGEALAARAAEDAPRLVARFAAQWEAVGYGPWAVEERETGRLLGHCGLRLLPELGGETEILYLLDSTVWGRGLASEGAAAARDYGLGRLGLTRLVAYALPENAASVRVLRRIGMREEGPARAFGLNALRYAIP